MDTQTNNCLDNQENNLLFNAIKNKFAAQTNEAAASFSPPKFSIPTLNVTQGFKSSTATTKPQSTGSNQLNLFLLKQLQDQQDVTKGKDAAARNSFVLPSIQFDKPHQLGAKFEIPLLKTTSATNSSISSLTTAINKLQVEENGIRIPPPSNATAIPATTIPPPAIDLSTALASKSPHHQGTPPTRDFHIKQKQQQQSSPADLNFEIPFIDCDRLDSESTKIALLAPGNEYCQIDISQLSLTPTCVTEPSAVGQFLCIVEETHYIPVPLKCLTSAHQYKKPIKHVIQPFTFDTKSPDDIVLASLEKYQRRHFH